MERIEIQGKVRHFSVAMREQSEALAATNEDLAMKLQAWSHMAAMQESYNAALRQSQERLELELREMMWLGHGHLGVYGDDGEMQCWECRTDYRRDPIEKVREAYRLAQIARVQAALAGEKEYK